MRRWVLSLLAVAAVGCAAPDLGMTSSEIVGGSFDNGKDPAVVLVQLRIDNAIGICSGSLLTPHIVMTAGHCVEDGGTYTVWFADSYDHDTRQFSGLLDDVTRTATVVFRHPGYQIDLGNGRLINDLALLVVDNPPPDEVKPLPFSRYRVESGFVGETVRMVGFGDRHGGQSFSLFQKLTAENTIDSVSADWFTIEDIDHLTCQGDSGGPAFRTVEGREVVQGITSFGDAGCKTNSSFARVDNFIGVIDDFIAEHDPQASTDCGADGVCGVYCPDGDPDCPCMADGKCTTACSDPDLDPDCPINCGQDGLCVPEGCPAPDPDCGTGAMGTSCSGNGDCASNLCVPDGSGKVCTVRCSSGSCPTSFSCDATSQICLPESGGGGCSCAVGPSGSGSASRAGWLGGLAVLGLLALGRRRRRGLRA